MRVCVITSGLGGGILWRPPAYSLLRPVFQTTLCLLSSPYRSSICVNVENGHSFYLPDYDTVLFKNVYCTRFICLFIYLFIYLDQTPEIYGIKKNTQKHIEEKHRNTNKKKALRETNTARAGCSKVRTPSARCHKPADRTDYNTLRRS